MPELEEWRENGGITAPHDGDVPQEVLELQHGKPQPRKTGAEPGTVSRETPASPAPRGRGRDHGAGTRVRTPERRRAAARGGIRCPTGPGVLKRKAQLRGREKKSTEL